MCVDENDRRISPSAGSVVVRNMWLWPACCGAARAWGAGGRRARRARRRAGWRGAPRAPCAAPASACWTCARPAARRPPPEPRPRRARRSARACCSPSRSPTAGCCTVPMDTSTFGSVKNRVYSSHSRRLKSPTFIILLTALSADLLLQIIARLNLMLCLLMNFMILTC